LTRSADTVTCLPCTTILSVLSLRNITLCGPLYSVSKARPVASCPRKTWVESRRSLWTNVAGDEWRSTGVGRRWSIWPRSCCMKPDASTFGELVPGAHQRHAGARHRRALLRMTLGVPCRRCVGRGGLVAGPRSTSRLCST